MSKVQSLGFVMECFQLGSYKEDIFLFLSQLSIFNFKILKYQNILQLSLLIYLAIFFYFIFVENTSFNVLISSMLSSFHHSAGCLFLFLKISFFSSFCFCYRYYFCYLYNNFILSVFVYVIILVFSATIIATFVELLNAVITVTILLLLPWFRSRKRIIPFNFTLHHTSSHTYVDCREDVSGRVHNERCILASGEQFPAVLNWKASIFWF